MSIITFLSDFGLQDHYVAAVKAKILSANPHQIIVDISHQIKSHDILHASFVLGAVFRDFPKGTVHLVAVDSQLRQNENFIAIKLEEHYFIGTDNGLFSLISEHSPSICVEISNNKNDIFPTKNILADVAVQLSMGKELENLGKIIPGINKKTQRSVKITPNSIVGSIVYIDKFGNLITNIQRNEVEKLREGKNIEIKIGREIFTFINQNYHDVEEGNCAIFFNSSNNLEIAINSGNANKLLGLEIDYSIQISFVNK